MSSLFHEVEVALADLGLAGLEAPELDVVVGGLGLGYTAWAALKHPGLRSLIVVETLEAVIEWHRRELVPLGPELTGDPRCRFVCGDFFALAAAQMPGFDPANPGRKFHAVLLDIDHSPRRLLHARHSAFYELAGLLALSEHLHPAGVFALWSDDPPDAPFLSVLREVFSAAEAHVVSFLQSALGTRLCQHRICRAEGMTMAAHHPAPRARDSPRYMQRTDLATRGLPSQRSLSAPDCRSPPSLHGKFPMRLVQLAFSASIGN